MKIKFIYGTDAGGPGCGAFYWPDAPGKREEYLQVKRGHPAMAEAIYQGNPGALEGDIFRSLDFRFFKAPKRLMDGFSYNIPFLAPADCILQAWDTAFSAKKDSDYSACVTAMLVPCDKYHGTDGDTGTTVESHYDVYILDVFRERVEFGDLLSYAESQYHRWHPSYVLIEKRASGTPLLQMLQQKGLPVLAVEPGIGSKRARAMRGVEAGSAQGWVQQHRVYFPSEALWLEAFLQELKNFSGNEDAHDDQVDSFVHLMNHAIRMGAEAPLLPSQVSPEQFAGSPAEAPSLEEALFPSVVNPFEQVCASCMHYVKLKTWCGLHSRKMPNLDSCESWDDGISTYPSD